MDGGGGGAEVPRTVLTGIPPKYAGEAFRASRDALWAGDGYNENGTPPPPAAHAAHADGPSASAARLIDAGEQASDPGLDNGTAPRRTSGLGSRATRVTSGSRISAAGIELTTESFASTQDALAPNKPDSPTGQDSIQGFQSVHSSSIGDIFGGKMSGLSGMMKAKKASRKLKKSHLKKTSSGGQLDTSILCVNERDIDNLRAAFEQIDEEGDGSGSLSLSELQRLWQTVFVELAEDDVTRITEHIFPDIDVDDSDEITFEELIQYLRGVSVQGNALQEISLLLGKVEMKDNPLSWKEWCWAVCEYSSGELYDNYRLRKLSALFAVSMQIVILGSVGNMIVESLPALTKDDGSTGNYRTWVIESLCIAIFTLEFFLRVISTPDYRKFVTSGFTWIDLFSIVPYYMDIIGFGEEQTRGFPALRALRIMRLVRVLRVAKLGKNVEGLQLMRIALVRARLALGFSAMLTTMAVLTFASLVWHVEKEGAVFDPTGSNQCASAPPCGVWLRPADSPFLDAGQAIVFQSIPDAMWWALVTLTTVGYGDSYPVTHFGRFLACIAMCTGILVVAYPVTILTTHLADVQKEFDHAKRAQKRRDNFRARLRHQQETRKEDALLRKQCSKLGLSIQEKLKPGANPASQLKASPAANPTSQSSLSSKMSPAANPSARLSPAANTTITAIQPSDRSPTAGVSPCGLRRPAPSFRLSPRGGVRRNRQSASDEPGYRLRHPRPDGYFGPRGSGSSSFGTFRARQMGRRTNAAVAVEQVSTEYAEVKLQLDAVRSAQEQQAGQLGELGLGQRRVQDAVGRMEKLAVRQDARLAALEHLLMELLAQLAAASGLPTTRPPAAGAAGAAAAAADPLPSAADAEEDGASPPAQPPTPPPCVPPKLPPVPAPVESGVSSPPRHNR